jgi:hypothetical protein
MRTNVTKIIVEAAPGTTKAQEQNILDKILHESDLQEFFPDVYVEVRSPAKAIQEAVTTL